MKTKGFFLKLAVLTVVVVPSLAYQDPNGKVSPAKTKPTPSPKAPPKTAEPSRKGTTTPTSKASTAGELTVKTAIPGSAVTFDGRARGTTGRDGLLNLPNLTPGDHILIVSKPGYQPEERRITINPRESQIVEIALTPSPVPVSVNVNIPGAKIQIANQLFEGSVTDLLLPPDDYEIKVSKPGYKTQSSRVELEVGKPKRISITLEKVPVETLLAQAEESFKARQYDQVITDCLDVISALPDQPRAVLLLGQSYFIRENHTDSVFYLVKAVRLGEQVTLPIKHHHSTLTKGDELCTGQFLLRRDGFEFQAVGSDHSFSSPWTKLYELSVGLRRNVPQLHTRVGVLNPKNKKEKKDDFNFFAVQSETRRSNPNLVTSTEVYCPNCQPTIDAIYQIMQQLKK
ncbi:MAG: carboxypeptidase regulatory-like domain-containing protein [Acidobacteria bacterium]|nr:carboxypeptidase regulatory-like domain-containing protein [Acidobacteriota bacterium]